MITEPCARRLFQVVHQEFVAGLSPQKAIERAFPVLGKVVQAQRRLRRLLVLELRTASAIQRADRGEVRRRDPKFDAQMSQHTRRDHLDGIERRPGEPEKADLQRHAQPVQRPTPTIDSASFILPKREKMRNHGFGQIVRKPLPTKVLPKRRVHDSVLRG